MFWLILGLLMGAGIYWMATQKKFKVTWYEWVLAILGAMLLLFAIQNFSASQFELEPRAGSIMLWMFGLPGLVLMALAAVLCWMHSRKETTVST
jgi:uncharacterized membrane protein